MPRSRYSAERPSAEHVCRRGAAHALSLCPRRGRRRGCGTCHVLPAFCSRCCTGRRSGPVATAEQAGQGQGQGLAWHGGPAGSSTPCPHSPMAGGRNPTAASCQEATRPCSPLLILKAEQAFSLQSEGLPSLALSTSPCCEEGVGGGLQKPGVTVLQDELRALLPHTQERRGLGTAPPWPTLCHRRAEGPGRGPGRGHR